MNKKYIFLFGLIQIFLVNAQEHNLPHSNFLNTKFNAINVDANYQNGNWASLIKEVEDKRIVLLGELNHGSKEIFLMRNDLIKSLHKELGFNVILFEAGIGELIEVDLQKQRLSASEMTNGFFSGWRTREFVELMDYVKANNISVSGFDVQRTGGSFQKILTDELQKLNLDTSKYNDIEKRFSVEKSKLTSRQAVYDSIQSSTNNLIADYELLKQSIEKSKDIASSQIASFVVRTIQNRIKYLQYFLNFVQDNDWNKRWKERDFMMFSNINWLLNNIYKNQKVIVVAHNFHISKFSENEEVMGEFLKTNYNEDMYVVGVFAGKGSFFNNRGIEEQLMPVSSEGPDIKEVINALNCKVGFLNIPKEKEEGMEWLFNKIIINDTFIDLSSSNKMILSKSFDGLLFIDKISPPEKQ